MEANVLAVDIGTSSVRAMLFRTDGSIVAKEQVPYAVERPRPGFEEQDPELLKRETVRAIGACLQKNKSEASSVKAICFSSQMYGIFALDNNHVPLCNIILWSDSRAEKQAKSVKKSTNSGPFYDHTGCPANSIYPVYKIAWLREEAPSLFRKARRFVSIKEYVLNELTGHWFVDHSLASATGLFDIRSLKWDREPLEYAGVVEEMLARPVAGEMCFPFTNEVLRREWGLPPDVQVFPGGGDGPLANIGSGAALQGWVNIDLGTSGAARATIHEPAFDEEGSLWCYCITKNLWAYGGILTNVGNAYQWMGTSVGFFRENHSETQLFDVLNRYAAEAEPGSNGLFFLPYLRKTRSPYWDDRLKGVIYGLKAEHDIRHITRSLLEAIAYDIAVIIEKIKAKIKVQTPILLTGGLSRNRLIPQILADVLDTPVKVPQNSEGSIAGAAILGFHGMGILKDYFFPSPNLETEEVFVPEKSSVLTYKECKRKYSMLVSIPWDREGIP
ncbi:MAG: gluconokinase [Spirochaetes bacterium]|nr:gluconokinase [Spirochaetota bacterium]